MPLLLVLSMAAFVSAFTIRMIDPLVPAIAREFHVPIETAALLATAYSLPYALAQPILGPLADAVGKARVIKVCLGCLACCLVLGAMAAEFQYLMVARLLAGLAGGGIIPVGFAMIGDRIPPEDRQVALARLVMASQIAILMGSAVGGLVAERYTWRLMFWWPASIAAGMFVVALIALPARKGAAREPFSLARVKAGYSEATAGPMAWVCLSNVFLGGLVMLGLMPYVASRLEQRGLGGLDEAGLVIAAYSVGGVAFTFAVRQLLNRLGRGGMVRLGGVLSALGLGGFAFSPSWIVEAFAFALVGAGYFMIHNSLQTLSTELAPNNRGAGVSLFAFIFFTGQAIGPVLYGYLYRWLGTAWPPLLCAAMLGFIALRLSRRLDEISAAQAVPPRG